MTSDLGVMTDMVSRPDDRIGSNGCKWLNDIGLHHERVFPNGQARPGDGLRADVACERVAERFDSGELLGAQSVHLAVADGDEDVELGRGKALCYILERHNRQAAEMIIVEKGAIDRIGNNAIVAV